MCRNRKMKINPRLRARLISSSRRESAPSLTLFSERNWSGLTSAATVGTLFDGLLCQKTVMPSKGAQPCTRARFNSLAPQQSENSPKQILSRIEPVNFEMRTERRSVTCSSEIFHERDRTSGSFRFAKLLRITDSRSDKESSWRGESELKTSPPRPSPPASLEGEGAICRFGVLKFNPLLAPMQRQAAPFRRR